MNTTSETKNKVNSIDFIKLIETKFIKNVNEKSSIEVGDIIRLGYTIIEGDK
jgi:hypothetical protein